MPGYPTSRVARTAGLSTFSTHDLFLRTSGVLVDLEHGATRVGSTGRVSMSQLHALRVLGGVTRASLLAG